MPGANTTQYNVYLKDLFGDVIADTVPSRAWFLKHLRDGTDEVEFAGKKIVFPVDVDANNSFGINLMDGGLIPTPDSRDGVSAEVNIANYASTTSVTDEALMRARNDEGAFARVAVKVARDTEKDLPKRVNASLYGPILAAVTVDGTGVTTITLDSVQYMKVGDSVVIGNRSTGAITATKTITARSIANKTITFVGTINVALATDGVWFPNAGPDATKLVEGLRRITATSRTLHNVNSSTYSTWDGNDVAMAGAEAGEQSWISLFDRIYEREQGEVTDALCSPGMQTRTARDLQSQKRFTGDRTTKLEGGFSALLVNDVPIVRDSDCPKGFGFAYDRKAFKLVKAGEPGWMEAPDGNGGIWSKVVDQATGQYKSEWQTTYRMYLNVLCEMPGATGRLSGAADDNPVI